MNPPVLVAFGIAHVDAAALRIDIGHRQGKALAQAQPEAVEGEKEDAVAQDASGSEQVLCLIDCDDVGQALCLGRLDQIGHGPRPAQHVGDVELVAIEIELDGAPGVRLDQLAEVAGELILGKAVDVVLEVLAHAPDAARIGINRLGLQALKLEVFEMGLVASIEVDSVGGGHAG